MKTIQNRILGFSLVELIVTIAVIGAITAIAIPSISNIYDASKKAKDIANAKHVEAISATLASLGVAHVIPDSMGGVEATVRLLREGVIVSDGPTAGEQFIVAGLSDEEISNMSPYLKVQYQDTELRLVSIVPDDSTFFLIEVDQPMYCLLEDFSPIEANPSKDSPWLSRLSFRERGLILSLWSGFSSPLGL